MTVTAVDLSSWTKSAPLGRRLANTAYDDSIVASGRRPHTPTPEPEPSPEKLEHQRKLNLTRHIRHFAVLEEEHCPGTPLVEFQSSGQQPVWKFCPKCKAVLEVFIPL